jgi:hypothetical protein
MAPAGGAAAVHDTSAVTQVVPTPAIASPPRPPPATGPAEQAQSDERPRRWRYAWALAALAAIAALALAAVVFLVNPGADGAADVSPSASASATESASPSTPIAGPAWLAGEVERLAEGCGDELARAEEANLAGMRRKDARDRVKELVEDCEDDGD